MSERRVLKSRNKEIYPMTHEKCVLDSKAIDLPNKFSLKNPISDDILNSLLDKLGNLDDILDGSFVDSLNSIFTRYNEIIEDLETTLTSLGLTLESSDLDVILEQVLTHTTSSLPKHVKFVKLGILPTAPIQARMEKIDNKVYVIGGYVTSAVKTNYCYDLDEDTCTTKTAMSANRYFAGSCVIDGFIYVTGGYATSEVKTNYRYDPTANSWSTLTAVPATIQRHQCFAINDTMYLSGASTTMYSYNPTSATWTTLSPSNFTTTYDRVGQVYNNKFYAFGGYNVAVSQCYDPTTNSWTTLASLPTNKQCGSAVVLKDAIYIIGGYVSTSNTAGDGIVYKYDIANNKYTQVNSVPMNLSWHTSVPYGDRCAIIQLGKFLYAFLVD